MFAASAARILTTFSIRRIRKGIGSACPRPGSSLWSSLVRLILEAHKITCMSDGRAQLGSGTIIQLSYVAATDRTATVTPVRLYLSISDMGTPLLEVAAVHLLKRLVIFSISEFSTENTVFKSIDPAHRGRPIFLNHCTVSYIASCRADSSSVGGATGMALIFRPYPLKGDRPTCAMRRA